jgi:3-oxoisoapionate decarboxylase
MYIEAMGSLPKNGDASEFERALQNAQAVGAICVRAANLSGRRYETFSSLTDWQDFLKQSDRSIEAAIPLLQKYRIPLALENHKDRTVDELVTLLKRYDNEYVGACVDFGNNISLLDDPMEVVEQLAPYAVSMHVKDMGVSFYEDGFLLSEVVLGEGFLDLPRMISAVHKARPKTRLSLEMITRDPLKVPCLTDKYWATFPNRNGQYLARTLKLVQAKTNHSKALERVSQLDHEGQVRAEEENVQACLRYARQKLRV